VGKQAEKIELCTARMLILMRLKEQGYLEGKTLQTMADWFDVNRSTILRDLRRIANAERRLPEIKSQIKTPPLRNKRRHKYKSSQPRQ
jgi:IS30 family transposase